ncbi:hypothetical protein QTP70_011040, partial [Hemibagrus guttatus]
MYSEKRPQRIKCKNVRAAACWKSATSSQCQCCARTQRGGTNTGGRFSTLSYLTRAAAMLSTLHRRGGHWRGRQGSAPFSSPAGEEDLSSRGTLLKLIRLTRYRAHHRHDAKSGRGSHESKTS